MGRAMTIPLLLQLNSWDNFTNYMYKIFMMEQDLKV